jgi:hypothetical protein
VACAALTGTVGIYMAAFSLGGWVTHLGFGLLGFFTLPPRSWRTRAFGGAESQSTAKR